MLLSVIIINYNTFQLTCNCIESIKKTTALDYEIILIDNNSKECSAALFLERFPELTLISLTENIGFGRANNIGMARASGKYFLLLNSDTVVNAGTLNETVTYLEKHPEVDILGCRSLFADGSTQLTSHDYRNERHFSHPLLNLIRENSIVRELRAIAEKNRVIATPATTTPNVAEVQQPIVPNYHNGHRMGSLVGVFLLLKRTVFEETKGFDPDFFMYYEETEWFIKRLRTYKMVYYPAASIIHFHGKSDVYNKMTLQMLVSYYLYWYKISWFHYGVFLVHNLVEIPSKLIVGLLRMKKQPFAELKLILQAFPYALVNVPKYSNGYGSRKEMLKVRFLRKKNL